MITDEERAASRILSRVRRPSMHPYSSIREVLEDTIGYIERLVIEVEHERAAIELRAAAVEAAAAFGQRKIKLGGGGE